MGKNRKNKPVKRYPTMYNKTQFNDIMCSNCKICDGIAGATFCYEYLYRRKPIDFTVHCMPKLIRLGSIWPLEHVESELMFERIFCEAEICLCPGVDENMRCTVFTTCYNTFQSQMYFSILGKNLSLKSFKGVLKKAKTLSKADNKAKSRFVVQPYPTFFSGGNDSDWFAEVRGIANGNEDSE